MRRVLILAFAAAPPAGAEAHWRGTLSPYAGAHQQDGEADGGLPDSDAGVYGSKAEVAWITTAGRAGWSASLLSDAGTVEDAAEERPDADPTSYADGRLLLGYSHEQARSAQALTLDAGMQFDGTSRARLPLAEQIERLDPRTPRRTSSQGLSYDGSMPLDARHAMAATLQLRRELGLGETRLASLYLLAERDMTASWRLQVGAFGMRVVYEGEPSIGYGPELRSVHAPLEAWRLTLKAGARQTRGGDTESGRTSAGGALLSYVGTSRKAEVSWQRELKSRAGTREIFSADVAALSAFWEVDGSTTFGLLAADRRQEAPSKAAGRQSVSSAGVELTHGLGHRLARPDGDDRHVFEVGAGGESEAAAGRLDATRTAWRFFARASF